MTHKTRVWITGIKAAFVAGAATTISTMAIDPVKFNLADWSGIQHVLSGAIVSGIIGVAQRLKQSPVPDPDCEEPDDTIAASPATTKKDL